MYDDYYGLKTDPFRLSPTGNRVFGHPSFHKSLAYLDYALHRREGIVLVCGPPGSGKTSLIMSVERSLANSSIQMSVVSCNNDNAKDLMRLYAAELGIESGRYDGDMVIQSVVKELKRLRSEGKHSLLVLDEAQGLSIGALEQVRLLTNFQDGYTPLLQIVLIGQPGLHVKVSSPELTQLHQRIVSSTFLKSLDVDETRNYFLHRMNAAGWEEYPKIEEGIYPLLHTASSGIPRCINQIGSRLLLHGYVEKRQTIGVEDIRQVISDLVDEHLLPVAAGNADSPNTAQDIDPLPDDSF